MKCRFALGATLLMLGLVTAAQATTNLLINGGLERAPGPYNQFGMLYLSPTHNQNMLPGWTITGGTVDIVPSSYWQVSQGNASVDLIGTPGIGGIEQTVNTTAATTYTLTFDLTANPEAGKLDETGTTKVLEVDALAADGTTVLATQIFDITKGPTQTKADMQWTTNNTFIFTATDATTTLRLSALAPLNMPAGGTGATMYTGPVIDNLNLIVGGGSSTTPEPAALSILGVGASALFLRRRRKG